MTFKLFNYISVNGENEFKAWTEKLEKIQRAKLNERMNFLYLHGEDLHPHTLTDTRVRGILKLRIQGNVKLRPLLCRGPINAKIEYTLLKGAKEIGSNWDPKKAPQIAAELKAIILGDHTRRVEHESID